MKLRIRASESKQTLRIDIPNDSTLQNLKQSIANSIGISSSLPLVLSLNRRDELLSSSPNDSLAALGISAGDLIFYSFVSDNHRDHSLDLEMETLEPEIKERDDDFGDESGRFPESCFLKRLISVLSDNFGGEEGVDHKLIVCAIHSVFLESGFVELSGEKLQFPSSMNLSMSLRYTVPEITTTESVIVKFQTLKNFITIYVASSTPGSPTHQACLNNTTFIPGIVSLLQHQHHSRSIGLNPLFELWRTTRDKLATPLMIELCSKIGLPGPACLARLPPELQLRILELLPGADVARVGCASKDLHWVAKDDDLWRRKFGKDFVAEVVEVGMDVSVPWRVVYSECWVSRQREEVGIRNRRERCRMAERLRMPVHPRPRRGPRPFMEPFGNDYDRFPGPAPFGLMRRGNFMPNRGVFERRF